MSVPHSETLVMTATFQADATPILVVRNERERMLHYLCALVAWSRTRRVQRIIFVENSNTGFDFSGVIRFLEAAGKDVEVLVFDGNSEAATFGKGYAEGRILEHTFQTSRLLRATTSFYKVTGRLFVKNFDAVSDATAAPDAFRMRPAKDGHAPKTVTTFFKCRRDLFEARLLDAYTQVTDEEGHRIEQAYFHRLTDLDMRDFPLKPVMVGQQGSTGKMYAPYEDEVIRSARSFLPPALP
jgi:hypothetical protein